MNIQSWAEHLDETINKVWWWGLGLLGVHQCILSAPLIVSAASTGFYAFERSRKDPELTQRIGYITAGINAMNAATQSYLWLIKRVPNARYRMLSGMVGATCALGIGYDLHRQDLLLPGFEGDDDFDDFDDDYVS